jgi:peroxiredoxin Q/BCP
VKVVGISTDSVQSHSDFCGRLKLNFPLLSDEDKKASKQYDAINFLGMNKRVLVLIGPNKKILWIDSKLPVTYIKTGEILEKIKILNISKMT